MKDPLLIHDLGIFLRALEASGLIPPDDLKRSLAEFRIRPATDKTSPVELFDLVHWLIGRGLITVWQYEKLVQGRFKGYFLDDYKLLGHLHTDDAYGYYLAVHTGTRCFVAIRVTPMSRALIPGKTEYLVVHEYV